MLAYNLSEISLRYLFHFGIYFDKGLYSNKETKASPLFPSTLNGLMERRHMTALLVERYF
ncbi:MAG: hypothetical protein P8L78_06660 [Mariniblastus sp.]|nr:hypothetical protein [Mariniblastus sp.]